MYTLIMCNVHLQILSISNRVIFLTRETAELSILMSFISSPKGEDKVQNVHSFSVPMHFTACDTSEHVSKSVATLLTCWKTSGEIYSQLRSWQHNTCNVRVHFPFYIVLLSSHHICFSHYSIGNRLPIQRRNSIPATKLTQILRPPATNNSRPKN